MQRYCDIQILSLPLHWIQEQTKYQLKKKKENYGKSELLLH